METSQYKPLKILNASAGSGKTFNLVKEYIELLLKEKTNSFKFAQIIAMTFTNKAAFEMKSRIIQALDELSFPEKYGKKSHDYAILIGNSIGINPEEIHIRAKFILQNLLHRYEDFNVLTIDKFNLKLIRSFSRDLNLSTDFEIIFNETEVLEKVIDKMMSELDISENNALTKIIFEYAKSNIEEGEKWDFRKSLISFSEVIKNEKYYPIVEHLLTSDFSSQRFSNIKLEFKRINDLFVSECQKVFQIFIQENLTSEELPDGSRTFNAIQKINNLTIFPGELFTLSFIKKCETIEVSNKKRFPQHLKEALLKLQNYWQQHIESAITLELFIKNFYNMALLQFMAKQLSSIRKEEQLIRISEFNSLISELVKNEDAPFIYERLGTRFQHFLLDEFQDTSHLQWLNMVPLVHESISNMNQNLIVGDPKQSIYRFKNGVAEQFVELPNIYNPENDPDIARKSKYFAQQGEMTPLKDNWRSSPIIVQFNNHLFELLKNELSEQNQSFYDSVYQNPKSILNGFVEVISEEKNKTDNYSEKEFDFILTRIEEAESEGFKRGDICILGDKNKNCNQWAIFLTEKGYDVVSADSLLVDSDLAVQLTISYLKRRLQPHSENEKRKFSEKYFTYSSTNNYVEYKKYFTEFESKTSGKKFSFFNDSLFLKEHFKSTENFFCKYENLYDLIQKFYRMMNLDELKNPYLHHLADITHQYDLNNGPDLKSFLNYYKQEGKKSAVQLPESENSIKIMTIHKSKGLEFPIVILPNLDLKNNLIGSKKYLFENDQYIFYSTAKKDSEISIIREFTQIENDLVFTDGLNVCYVALTRPIERLYIYNAFDKNKFGNKFNTILPLLNYDESTFKLIKNEATIHLTIGNKVNKQELNEKKNDRFFIPKTVTDKLWFPDISFKEKNKLNEIDSIISAQRYGNQLHYILANINSLQEIDIFISSAIKTGKIEQEHCLRLKTEITDLFNNDQYKSIFNDVEDILSEQDLIIGKHEILRPDKIVIKNNNELAIIIDYKTGLPNKKYIKQVTEYAQSLKQIGYQNVEAYLYFTGTKKLEKILSS